jgi:hypothetical protein
MGYVGVWNGKTLDLKEMDEIPRGYVSELVGGVPQMMPNPERLQNAGICGCVNEEGKYIPLPKTAYLISNAVVFDEICGPIVFMTIKNGDFFPLNEQQSYVLEIYLANCPEYESIPCFQY